MPLRQGVSSFVDLPVLIDGYIDINITNKSDLITASVLQPSSHCSLQRTYVLVLWIFLFLRSFFLFIYFLLIFSTLSFVGVWVRVLVWDVSTNNIHTYIYMHGMYIYIYMHGMYMWRTFISSLFTTILNFTVSLHRNWWLFQRNMPIYIISYFCRHGTRWFDFVIFSSPVYLFFMFYNLTFKILVLTMNYSLFRMYS